MKITFVDNGNCELLLGKTRVSCIVSASVVEPFPDKPNDGSYSFDVMLSPMASSSFPKDSWTSDSVQICRVVERALRESRAIETESLCILAGSKVWAVRVALHVLDHCGNLVDACSAAALASLLHFRCPSVAVDNDGRVVVHDEREPAPLAVYHTPVSVTFGFVLNSEDHTDTSIVDPTDEEEQVLEGFLSFAINGHGELCSVQKAGGCPLEVDTMLRCLNLATIRAAEIIAAVTNAVKVSLKEKGAIIRRNLISYLEAEED